MHNNNIKGNIQVVKCTNCFKSVSVPSRMAIYNFLNSSDNKKGESTVGEIVEIVGLTQPTVSYHLKEMRYSGLLRSRKEGKEVFYSVNTSCPHHEGLCVLHKLEFPGMKKNLEAKNA